jgi:hypothetical protein
LPRLEIEETKLVGGRFGVWNGVLVTQVIVGHVLLAHFALVFFALVERQRAFGGVEYPFVLGTPVPRLALGRNLIPFTVLLGLQIVSEAVRRPTRHVTRFTAGGVVSDEAIFPLTHPAVRFAFVSFTVGKRGQAVVAPVTLGEEPADLHDAVEVGQFRVALD